MIIKEFLKLTKWKIIITLIILLIYEAFVFYQGSNRLIDCIGKCPTQFELGINEIIGSFLNPLIVLKIIIFYLVSCLIIFIVKKIKAKRK